MKITQATLLLFVLVGAFANDEGKVKEGRALLGRSLYGYGGYGGRFGVGGNAAGGNGFGGPGGPAYGGLGRGGDAYGGGQGGVTTVYQTPNGGPTFVGPVYGAPAYGGTGAGGGAYGGPGGNGFGGGAYGGPGWGRRRLQTAVSSAPLSSVVSSTPSTGSTPVISRSNPVTFPSTPPPRPVSTPTPPRVVSTPPVTTSPAPVVRTVPSPSTPVTVSPPVSTTPVTSPPISATTPVRTVTSPTTPISSTPAGTVSPIQASPVGYRYPGGGFGFPGMGISGGSVRYSYPTTGSAFRTTPVYSYPWGVGFPGYGFPSYGFPYGPTAAVPYTVPVSSSPSVTRTVAPSVASLVSPLSTLEASETSNDELLLSPSGPEFMDGDEEDEMMRFGEDSEGSPVEPESVCPEGFAFGPVSGRCLRCTEEGFELREDEKCHRAATPSASASS